MSQCPELGEPLGAAKQPETGRLRFLSPLQRIPASGVSGPCAPAGFSKCPTRALTPHWPGRAAPPSCPAPSRPLGCTPSRHYCQRHPAAPREGHSQERKVHLPISDHPGLNFPAAIWSSFQPKSTWDLEPNGLSKFGLHKTAFERRGAGTAGVQTAR